MHLLNFLECLSFLPEFSTLFSQIHSIRPCFSCRDVYIGEEPLLEILRESFPCGWASCCVWSFPSKCSSISSIPSLWSLTPAFIMGLVCALSKATGSPQECSSQQLVLGLSEFLLVCMKKKATVRKKAFRLPSRTFLLLRTCPQCQDACYMACSANSVNRSSRKISFFPSCSFFIEFTCSFHKKPPPISSCSVCNSMRTFFPDFKPQQNLNTNSAQDLTEWKFIYIPIFTIPQTHSASRLFFSLSSVFNKNRVFKAFGSWPNASPGEMRWSQW